MKKQCHCCSKYDENFKTDDGFSAIYFGPKYNLNIFPHIPFFSHFVHLYPCLSAYLITFADKTKYPGLKIPDDILTDTYLNLGYLYLLSLISVLFTRHSK